MNGNLTLTESSDLEKVAFLIKCEPEYETLINSKSTSSAWKDQFISCVDPSATKDLVEYKKRLLTFLQTITAENKFTTEILNALQKLQLFISDLLGNLRTSGYTEPLGDDGVPNTALLYNFDGTVLFSGIKKLPGKLELPSELQEIKVIDTHLEIKPPSLQQSCPTALPTQALYPSCMRAVLPVKSLYYGVYSSFGPSYDSSYSNVNLEDGYEDAGTARGDSFDYELLEHEGIDYNVLLNGVESRDPSEANLLKLDQNTHPTGEIKPNTVSHPTHPTGLESIPDPSEILSQNRKRLQKLKLSQRVRLRYRDLKPSQAENETAFKFLHTSAQLASLLPPSKLMAGSAPLRAIHRFPYKEPVFKGTLGGYRPYPNLAEIWPNSTKDV